MLLSKAQLGEFFGSRGGKGLWPRYCLQMGWTTANGLTSKQIDEKRREFLRGLGFESLTQVDRTDGYTKVRNELKAALNDDLDAARETFDPDLNSGRVLRHKIEKEILPCIALYQEYPEQYLQTVITGLSRWNKTDRPTVPVTLDDLDDSPIMKTFKGRTYEGASKLKQAVMTLSARLNVMRNEAGDSIHTMKKKAGLKCGCAQCVKKAAQPIKMETFEEATPVDPDVVPW